MNWLPKTATITMPRTVLTHTGALVLWTLDNAKEGDNRARAALAGIVLVISALCMGVAFQITRPSDMSSPLNEIGRGQTPQKTGILVQKPETIQDLIHKIDADIDDLNNKPREKTTEEAFALLGEAEETDSEKITGAFSESSLLMGRHDPFQPLVTTGNGGGPAMMDVEPGPLDFVQYVGVIGEPGFGGNHGNAVAIIRVNDPVNNQSLVKRIGDSFSINGESITLKAIKPDEIVVKMGGETRNIPLNTFVDRVMTSAAEDAPPGDIAGGDAPGPDGSRNGPPPETFEELAE